MEDATTNTTAAVDTGAAEAVAAAVDPMVLLGQYIGAGLASFGLVGGAIGVGLIFAAAINGTARNPAKEGAIRGLAIFGMALSEVLGLLAFVLAMLILFK